MCAKQNQIWASPPRLPNMLHSMQLRHIFLFDLFPRQIQETHLSGRTMCLPFTGSQTASFLWRLDAGEKTIYATEVGPDGFGKRFGTCAPSCLAMINSWLLAPEILDHHQISCCRPSKVTLLAMDGLQDCVSSGPELDLHPMYGHVTC